MRSTHLTNEIGLAENDKYKYFVNEIRREDGGVYYKLVRYNKEIQVAILFTISSELFNEITRRGEDFRQEWVKLQNQAFDTAEQRLMNKSPEPTVSFQIDERRVL